MDCVGVRNIFRAEDADIDKTLPGQRIIFQYSRRVEDNSKTYSPTQFSPCEYCQLHISPAWLLL
jgi:hypothetical protein